jgi:hypothetical protein
MNPTNMKKEPLPIHTFAFRLRALVLALGEAGRPPFWKTEFFNETGFRFLERIYPRNFFKAAIYSAGKGACEIHDRAVGRVGIYHLFRLPEFLELDIYKIILNGYDEFLLHFRSNLGSFEKLMPMLKELYESSEDSRVTPGAKRIGSGTSLLTVDVWEKLADSYYRSFNQGKLGFPYFSEDYGKLSWRINEKK